MAKIRASKSSGGGGGGGGASLSLIPNQSDNTNIVYSQYSGSSFQPYYAFTSNVNNGWAPQNSIFLAGEYIGFNFGTSTKISAVSARLVPDGGRANSFKAKVQISTNGSNYTDVPNTEFTVDASVGGGLVAFPEVEATAFRIILTENSQNGYQYGTKVQAYGSAS